jgi:ParB-like chromosome segregation protein Spo0J
MVNKIEQMEHDLGVAKKLQELVDKFGGDKTRLAKVLGFPDARMINERLAILDVDPEALRILYGGRKE